MRPEFDRDVAPLGREVGCHGLCPWGSTIIKSPPAYRPRSRPRAGQAGSPLFALRARGPMGRRLKRGKERGNFAKEGNWREKKI